MTLVFQVFFGDLDKLRSDDSDSLDTALIYHYLNPMTEEYRLLRFGQLIATYTSYVSLFRNTAKFIQITNGTSCWILRDAQLILFVLCRRPEDALSKRANHANAIKPPFQLTRRDLKDRLYFCA